jgi:hypothetical protein
MSELHPKSVRRRLLKSMYERYQRDPLEMLAPEDFLEDGVVTRANLVASMYYLKDRGLAEVMLGYNPPLFAAARITANGIDLVENHFEFNLRFPPAPGDAETAAAGVPVLVERLVEEGDFVALDGEKRRALLRDVQYLRDELARPVECWRRDVVNTVLDWLAGYTEGLEDALPSLDELRRAVEAALK